VFKDRFDRGSGSFSGVVDRLPPTPLIAEMGPAAPHTPLDVEGNVPLPKNATEAMPPMSVKEELEVRARTIKLLADLQGKSLEPDSVDKEKARELAKQMIDNPRANIDFSNYRNETLAYLAGMVASYDQMLVKELADYKLYVVNKLVEQSANPDPKLSYPAIKSLGEIDGVDAFKRRSEVTVQVKPIDEVEKDLLARLEKLERLTQNAKSEEVIDVEAIDADSREDTEA
jgi:hypothetical protein